MIKFIFFIAVLLGRTSFAPKSICIPQHIHYQHVFAFRQD